MKVNPSPALPQMGRQSRGVKDEKEKEIEVEKQE